MKKRQIFSSLVALMLTLALFAACTPSGSSSAAETPDSTQTTSTEANSEVVVDEFTYPMETDVVLTCFSIYPKAQVTHEKYEDTELAKYLTEQTGIKVEYTFGTGEQFNVMVASGDAYDLLEFIPSTYPGGPGKAISDGVLIALNDLAEFTPNLNALLAGDPELDKMVKTDSGEYYVFPFVRGDPRLQTFQGPIIRQDWLDDLDLERPTTIDETEAVLQAFKDEKGATAPLSVLGINFLSNLMGSAYGLGGNNYYVKDGEIVFGPYTDNYKAFLEKANDWYNKGLIDPSFGAVDSPALDANVLNGATGLTVQNSGGGIGRWMNAKVDEPTFQLSAVPYLVANKGDTPTIGQVENKFPGGNYSISANCKNPEVAARFLDYGYSEAGYMAYNFGIEGESYNMVDGYPTFTEIITSNPDGLSMADALAIYVQSVGGGSFVQDWRYMEQYTQLDSQKEAITMWSDNNAIDHLLPPLYFTEDESKTIAKLSADINVLVVEKSTKYVVGAEDISTFESYQAELEALGIEELTKIYADAYARYQQK